MITLTIASAINSVLGGNVPVNYDKLVLSQMNFRPIDRGINGRLALTSTTNPEMPEISGSMDINLVTAQLEITVPQLDFYRKVTLTGPQQTAVAAVINDAQDALEGGLVTLGVVDGAQATGV